MASYIPPKKNAAFIVYVSLEDQANAGLMKTSPTLAAGDFKVSIDGGALANLATLPTNTPSGSAMVKISLSADEMNGDNITVVCKDAAGAEWYDLVLNIQTSARQIDDLAYPATSGRSLTVAATGEASANVTKQAGVAVAAADAYGNVLVDVRRWAGDSVNDAMDGNLPSYVYRIFESAHQDVANALLLAPVGAAADGSAMAELAAILEDTGTTLPGLIAAGGSGDGAITFVYTLTNSVGGAPIADADVWVTSDVNGSNVVASGRTDQNGVVTFYLDSGTVYVWRQKSGWDFTNPDTEVVS